MNGMRGVLTGFALAALTTSTFAQTVSAGPYYATPSWDQKLQCDTAPACVRFIVLANWNNEAVLDRETGLVWQRTANNGGSTSTTYADAVQMCWTAATGGRQGWHLPRVEEFLSLSDPSNPANTALPTGNPFINVLYLNATLPGIGPVSFGNYWSADKYPFNPALAAEISFAQAPGLPSGGQVSGVGTAGSSGVWCVRAGAGAPQR